MFAGKVTGLALAVVALAVAGVALTLLIGQDGRRKGEPRPSDPSKVLIGVLGDSDSSPYHDHVLFPAAEGWPGGAFHDITMQWSESLVRIRAPQVDMGEWAVWGVPRVLSMSRVRDALGFPWRAPQRETYQNDLAIWGARCEELNHGAWRQTQRLMDVMDEQPERWASGVVVIRIGINNFGRHAQLDALARNPDDPVVKGIMLGCVEQIQASVKLIHERHPRTRIVLVGIFNNAHWPPYLSRWQSALEQANLNRGLDHFDNALRSIAAADSRLAFFDDRAWFARHWGGRDLETGLPNYRTVNIGNVITVTNTAGDHPSNAALGNEHNGLVWNLLWSQELVQLMRTKFDVRIDTVTDDEVADYLRKALAELPTSTPTKLDR